MGIAESDRLSRAARWKIGRGASAGPVQDGSTRTSRGWAEAPARLAPRQTAADAHPRPLVRPGGLRRSRQARRGGSQTGPAPCLSSGSSVPPDPLRFTHRPGRQVDLHGGNCTHPRNEDGGRPPKPRHHPFRPAPLRSAGNVLFLVRRGKTLDRGGELGHAPLVLAAEREGKRGEVFGDAPRAVGAHALEKDENLRTEEAEGRSGARLRGGPEKLIRTAAGLRPGQRLGERGGPLGVSKAAERPRLGRLAHGSRTQVWRAGDKALHAPLTLLVARSKRNFKLRLVRRQSARASRPGSWGA